MSYWSDDESVAWRTELLLRHVIRKAHEEIHQMLHDISADFNQLAIAYPQYKGVRTLFLRFGRDLELHLSKELICIFTYVRRYTKELRKDVSIQKPALNSVCPSIHKMYQEHKFEEFRFELLLQLMESQNFLPTTEPLSVAILKKLKALYHCWKTLARLEDNVLFPDIVAMEATLTNPNL